MDFFDRQEHSHRMSRWLVLLFIAAVVAIVAATTLLVLVVMGQPQNPDIGLFSSANLQRQSGLLLATAFGAGLAMGLASLFRSVTLRGGGGKVARELGGQRLDADTRDPQLQQLQNVVEEIALAAGVPVPEIYVLEDEDGINAFAAGYSPADAAIAVTRGTLDKLDRAELQGVIAHEFSHILNGDMRLNIRLMGLVFGILVLAIIGQRILFGSLLVGGGRRRNNGAAAILAIGVGMVAIGYIGLFFGRWIKAAVARQRESLADASAVQFTRHPEGIAGALKKIAVYSEGAQLQAPTEQVNHMLFGEGSKRRMFATHPPLVERIRAIEPDFDEQELTTLAERLRKTHEPGEPEPTSSRSTGGGAAPFDVDALIDRIGRVDGQTLAMASTLSESLPGALMHAARGVDTAPALALLLLLGGEETVRSRQLEAIHTRLGESGQQRVLKLLDSHGTPTRAQRLPLLDAALPSLKRRSPAQLDTFAALVTELSEADHQISPFEFLLGQILRGYLRDAQQPSAHSGHARLEQHAGAAAITLAALAHFGHPKDRSAAQAAFDAGQAQLATKAEPTWPNQAGWSERLRDALEKLDTLALQAKKTLIRAWIASVLHDRTAAPAELELLRAFCISIHVPMPPVHNG